MYQPENKSGTPLAPGKRGMPKGAAMGRADTSVTETDVMSDFFAGVMQLAADAQQRLTGKRALRCGSEAMAVAVEAGFPPRMAYSVKEVSEFTGISRSQLYKEHDAGRLRWVIPAGSTKGAVISVAEIDRWMAENMA